MGSLRMVISKLNKVTTAPNAMVFAAWLLYWLFFVVMLQFGPFLDMDDLVWFWLFSVTLVGIGNFAMLVSIMLFEQLHAIVKLTATVSSLSISLTISVFLFRMYWA